MFLITVCNFILTSYLHSQYTFFYRILKDNFSWPDEAQIQDQEQQNEASKECIRNQNGSFNFEPTLREFRGLLNKLAPDNFDRISLQIFELIENEINEAYLENVSDLIIYHVNFSFQSLRFISRIK